MSHPIVIVGAGLVGASIAYHLGRRGTDVLVLDQGGGGASAASFGWINASFFLSPDHYRLRLEALAAWRRFEKDLPGVFEATGCVAFDEETMDSARELAAFGYPFEDLNEEAFQVRLPGVKVPQGGGLYFPEEGATDPLLTARRLLASSGARVFHGVQVEAIEPDTDGSFTIHHSFGQIAASQVIVATGTGAPALLEPLGVPLPLLHRPGFTMVSKPVAFRLQTVLATSGGEVRQISGGRLLISGAISHQSDEGFGKGDDPMDLARRAAARVEEWLPVRIEWQDLRMAQRPMPRDGLPAIGPAGPKGVWAAVMHSGVTLAPLVGELMADEVLGERTHVMLRPFRVDRFAGA